MRRNPLHLLVILLTCAAASAILSGPALADVVYDEGADGDLSDDYLNPTLIPLTPGVNSVISSSGQDDLGITDIDMLTITLPPGTELRHLILSAYDGDSAIAFLGIQAGSAFTFDPVANDSECLGSCLGGSHFGPGTGDDSGLNIGDDLLPAIGASGIGTGFTPPLTGSQYTIWLQENGEGAMYTLDFVVVPEPAACSLVVLSAAGALVFTRRQRRQ
jgi:hypothetical protein